MGSGPSLEVTGRQAVDPATQRRQEHLFRQAEGFAAQQPFQRQYGYGTQMVPGLSGMSQTGQAYLSDKILGKGAYAAQDLGFQQYRRPTSATAGGYQYGQSGYMPGQEFQPGYAGGRYRVGAPPEGGDASMAWGGGGYTAGDGIGRDEGDGGGDLSDAELEALGQYDDETLASGETVRRYIQPGEWARRAQYGVTPYEPTTGESIADVTPGSWAGSAPNRYTGLMYPQGEADDFAPWDPRPDQVALSEELNPMYEQNIWNEYARSDPYYNQPSFGLQNVPDAASAAEYAARGGDPTALGYTPATGGGLLQTDLGRPTAGVGIGEVEDARTATRRMLLEQGREGGLDYDRFLQGTGGAATDKGYVPPGWEGIGKAEYNQFLQGTGGDPDAEGYVAPGLEGIDTAEGYADFLKGYTDDKGVEQPADWYGLGPAAGTEAFLPGEGVEDTKGYVPPGWQEQATAKTGTAPTQSETGIAALEPWQTVSYDPDTGARIVDKGTFRPEYDEITAQALVPGTGETRAAYGDASVASIQDQYKDLTPEQIRALELRFEPPEIKDATRLGGAAGTIDKPIAAGTDYFGGSSFLGGPAGFEAETVDVTGYDPNDPEQSPTDPSTWGKTGTRQTTPIEAYMDAGGVSSQVTAAQRDYLIAQNQEQSRRAQSKAWGTRGDIPRAEQEQQMLARISEIRRKGYGDAADRMEADLQREQAAGMQTQQLGTQGALQAQQLEAQRREATAARQQQAGLAQQQLGTEAAMQTQRLGVGADQRTAELEMQAALANQQAALQTGSQSAQLEADRRMQQAQIDLQRTQQTQQLGAGAAAQAAELESTRRQQLAGMGQQAAQQQSQLEFGRREALAGMGQEAATQQTALEAQRRQQLAQMGLTSAQQQTQNEFARRQGLAEMGLQAQGMGMDDQARFRQQQMQLAEQLGRQGLDEQAATFTAAQQLAQMGGTQEQRQQMQAAADYEQWLRSQEGFADEAAFLQAMQPTPSQMQYQRKPSVWGQVAGGLLSAGGSAATAFGSDARIKDNIEYVGMENGFKTYEFNYLGRDNRYRGVMAQEVMLERPDAVEIQDGFYRVNYDAIGVQFEAI